MQEIQEKKMSRGHKMLHGPSAVQNFYLQSQILCCLSYEVCLVMLPLSI
jgi:hypothetical protein